MTTENKNTPIDQLKSALQEISVFSDVDRNLLASSGRLSDSIDVATPKIAIHSSLILLAEGLMAGGLQNLTSSETEQLLKVAHHFLAAAAEARRRPGEIEVQKMFRETLLAEQSFREIQEGGLTSADQKELERRAEANFVSVAKKSKEDNNVGLTLTPRELMASLELKRAEIERRLLALEKISTEASKLIQDLTDTSANYIPLYENSKSLLDDLKSIKDQALETLTSASQVGLASAFGARKKSLARSALYWIGGFIAGLGLILAATLVPAESALSLTYKIFDANLRFDTSPPALLLAKISVLAPCIWLAWFAARQYAKTQRLMEDYAYKEAAAHAYVGYRNEMQNDPELIKLLREAAIKTFSENPNASDFKIEAVSPLHELLEKCIDRIPSDKIADVFSTLLSQKK